MPGRGTAFFFVEDTRNPVTSASLSKPKADSTWLPESDYSTAITWSLVPEADYPKSCGHWCRSMRTRLRKLTIACLEARVSCPWSCRAPVTRVSHPWRHFLAWPSTSSYEGATHTVLCRILHVTFDHLVRHVNTWQTLYTLVYVYISDVSLYKYTQLMKHFNLLALAGTSARVDTNLW